MILLALKEPPEKEKEKEIRPGVSLVSYRQFFRELDLEVLSVLQCGLLSRSLLDSELHTKVKHFLNELRISLLKVKVNG